MNLLKTDMSFSLYQVVILIGVINGVILFLALSSLPVRSRKSARFLGFFILGFVLYFFNWIVGPSIGERLNIAIPWIPVLYFLPAFAYCFVASLSDSTDKTPKNEWLWFIPGFLDMIYQIVKWVETLTINDTYVFPLANKIEFFLYEIGGLVFSAFCLFKIFRLIKDHNLKYHGTTRTFYKVALCFLVFVQVRWAITLAIEFIEPELKFFDVLFTFWVIELSFFLFFGYKSLINPNTYAIKLLRPQVLTEGQDDLGHKLKLTLENERLYLNPELSRKELSDKMNLSEAKISKVLNEELNTNFYYLINQLRVEEAKRLLKNGMLNKLSLEGLAKESGFKSKTTFYKFFRHYTGSTPGEFRNSIAVNKKEPLLPQSKPPS